MPDIMGYRATRDGKFKGRKIECAVCGLMGRRLEMVYQRGKLVHRSTCRDQKAFREVLR